MTFFVGIQQKQIEGKKRNQFVSKIIGKILNQAPGTVLDSVIQNTTIEPGTLYS